MFRKILASGMILAVLTGCAAERGAAVSSGGSEGYIAPTAPPELVAASAADAAQVVASSQRYIAGLLGSGRGMRLIGAEQSPFIFGAVDGRRFRAAGRKRAMAMGSPLSICPAVSVAGEALGRAPGASSADFRAEAISGCFAELAARGAPSECGCRLVAADSVLLASEEFFAYAPGVSARATLTGPARDLTLVAREEAGEGGARVVTLYPAPSGGFVATIRPDGKASAVYDGETYLGEAVQDGLRRGRYAERLYLSAPSGRRMILAIGYEPVEYAERRSEILDWPAEG